MDQVGFDRGVMLFNSGHYFDAHEVWEDVWRAAPVEEKKFLQGLIQIAVALHHHSRGNLAGARSLLARAQRNLADYSATYEGVDLAAVRAGIRASEKALAEGKPITRLQISRSQHPTA
jgi:predicted metal-dependent hydrolase